MSAGNVTFSFGLFDGSDVPDGTGMNPLGMLNRFLQGQAEHGRLPSADFGNILNMIQQMHEPVATPAAVEAIDALKRTTVDEENVKSLDNCSICLEEYKPGDKLLEIPCKHNFHEACIKPWLNTHKHTCPVCRYELPTEEKDQEESDQNQNQDTPNITNFNDFLNAISSNIGTSRQVQPSEDRANASPNIPIPVISQFRAQVVEENQLQAAIEASRRQFEEDERRRAEENEVPIEMPAVLLSNEEYKSYSISTLRCILDTLEVNHSQCVEKTELVHLLCLAADKRIKQDAYEAEQAASNPTNIMRQQDEAYAESLRRDQERERNRTSTVAPNLDSLVDEALDEIMHENGDTGSMPSLTLGSSSDDSDDDFSSTGSEESQQPVNVARTVREARLAYFDGMNNSSDHTDDAHVQQVADSIDDIDS